jgi:hypothetical protein
MDATIVSFVKEKMTLWPQTVDDDFVDRLHHHYTCALLLIFAAIGFLKSFLGEPLQCFVPANYKASWEKYAESYCFIQHTYYVPWEEDIPMDSDRRTRRHAYYQWVPLLLGLQAFLFYVPSWFWKQLYWKSGFRLDTIVKSAMSAQSMRNEEKKAMKIDDRDNAVKLVAEQMQEGIEVQRERRVGPWADFQQALGSACGLCMCRKKFGNLLVNVYLLTKLLYLVNIAVQMFIVHAFVGAEWRDFPFFGLHLLLNLTRGIDWHASGTFPRVTYCDFKVRVVGQPKPQPHTVQCVLPVNMLNEKIYLVLWFWFVFLFGITIYNVGAWLWRTYLPFNSRAFVGKYLKTVLYKKPLPENPKDADTDAYGQYVAYEQKFNEWFEKRDKAVGDRKRDLDLNPPTPGETHGLYKYEYLNYSLAMKLWKTRKDEANCDKQKANLDNNKPERPNPPQPSDDKINEFVSEYLKRDGVFVLRVVAASASYLVTSLLIKEIFLTKNEGEIDKKKKEDDEAQKKVRSDSSTGRSTPSGRLPPLDEGVDTLPQHTFPPNSKYPRALGQNIFDDSDQHPLVPPHK